MSVYTFVFCKKKEKKHIVITKKNSPTLGVALTQHKIAPA